MTARPSTGAGRWLFAVSLAVYFLSSYGGVRSPDAEVMFLTGEALATRGTFALDHDSDWPGFGTARGRDGRRWAVFGPLTSIVAVPFIAIARGVVRAGVVDGVAFHPSHFFGHGLAELRRHAARVEAPGHALRALVDMTMDPLVSALCVLLFFRLALRLVKDARAAIAATAVFAFGTLMWSYSCTFFSEPLTILLVLASLLFLVDTDDTSRTAGLAGLCFGLVLCAHVTGVLFAPLYAILLVARRDGRRARIVGFGAGLVVPLLLLLSYNALRFGDPLETGRQVDANAAHEFGYGVWVAPWKGLYGLTIGTGKGLVPYCPAVILGLVGLGALARRQRGLALAVVATVVLRVVFISCRSDWHGGFCLGPRLLLPIVPLALLPVACLFDDALATRPRAILMIVGAFSLCAMQQLYFSLGEVYSYYHVLMRDPELGRLLFEHDAIYLGSPYSPLLLVHEGMRGPWLMQGLPFAPLFAVSALLVLGGAVGLGLRLRRAA